MRVKFYKILFIALVFLQFVAPLVHAHSGNDFARFGLHLPTFEIYSVAQTQNFIAVHSIDILAPLEDAIVSISTGIENPQNDTDDLSFLFYFPPPPIFVSLTLKSCEINFSPQLFYSTKLLVYSPHSPRAPPV